MYFHLQANLAFNAHVGVASFQRDEFTSSDTWVSFQLPVGV